MRRGWLALLVALAACGGGPAPDLLPAELAGWQRVALRDIDTAKAPEPVAAAQRIVEATYDQVAVRVYSVSAPAMGLDFVQRWQAPPNIEYFYEGSYVVVIGWRTPERPDLRAFSAALRAHLRSL